MPTATAPTAPWVAYQGPLGLALVRLDGSDNHLFPSDDAARMRHPDWSPDGQQLAYRLDGPGDMQSLWISNLDGSDAHQLVECRRPCESIDDPAWSPDGKRIAYWTSDAGTQVQSIEIIDVASRALIDSVSGAPFEGPIGPRWSPSGDQLVVEIGRYSTKFELLETVIGIIDLTVNKPTINAITEPEMAAGYPDWSPASDSIVFQAGNLDPFSAAGEPPQLFTIRPEGASLIQLTSRSKADPFVALPSWAEGGREVLITLIHSDDNFTLARMSADGTDPREILDDRGLPIVGAHMRVAGR